MFKWIALALSLLLSTAQAQQPWQEGKHYEVINDSASASPHVKEVFSFWCPHCFTFEPIVADMKKQLPDSVAFTKAHVNFMGSASREAQDAATALMLAAKAMGDSERFNSALFSAIHTARTPIAGQQDILDIYRAAGGDADKLAKMAASFGIRSLVRKNDKATVGFNRVPAFIINDKYKVVMSRDLTPDTFTALVLWLTQQK
ncbi:thiol:disulfide interchange protein DsbA/DsbL [Aestuariibacter halophilus]|uniref:Thiol:disulfide interchange protein n=1 Tax=Fluctibacter halophilus TaxID=226011 RepID=A0ABS8G782_9ALTE|nr:thiol:disulfide interchange protein DsbA/DsbL [Aestuariibacter halophilus]MCC2616400.1 thiol:disulfide interchange protein DsbA/DsbL [Aestuariibacter halophilus]